MVNVLWPGVEFSFRGDGLEDCDESRLPKCLGRRVRREGSRVGVESVLTRKEMHCKCLFFDPEVSSNFWVLSFVSRVIVNFTLWDPGLRSKQTFWVEGKLSWAGTVTR